MTANLIGRFRSSLASHPINCLLLILSILLKSEPLLADSLQNKANLVDGAGFQLEAKAQFWPVNFNKPPRNMRAGYVEFSETYSPRSKRAKIVQRLYGKPPRKYFLTGDEPKLIKLAAQKIPEHETEVMKCEQIERDNLVEDLFEVEGDSREMATNWLAIRTDAGAPDYLLGMAQLLFIFDSNRDRLKPIWDMQRIRELQCQRYDLELKLGQLDLTLSAYVGENTLVWNGVNLPLRIWVKTKTRGLMMVDFYSIRALPERPKLEQLNYYVDPTTVDLGYGCYENSAREQNYPTFHEIYTMHFEVVDIRNLPTRREFIAFDGRQQAFRRESMASSGVDSRETITIYDLKHNVKFTHRPTPVVSHDFVGSGGNGRCIGSPTWLPGDRPFMPFDKFVKMGTGVVRGVEVVISEYVSKKPPEIFLPAARYLFEGLNLIQSRFVSTLASGPNRAGPFSVVYYFEPQNSPKGKLALGRLLRFDLMANGRLLTQVNVYNFLWQLTDAPNGDRKERLFRIPSSCYDEQSSTTARRLLGLELEYQSATSSRITEPVALDVVASVPVRSMGLLRSLSEQVDDISVTRISNIVSVLRKSQTFGEHFKLFIGVELALGIEMGLALQPVSAAWVTIINGQKPIRDVTNFEQCFYEAGLRFELGRREVLFAFIDDAYCYIDSGPIYETSNKENATIGVEFTYSNVFRFSRSQTSGHIAMRITQVDAGESLNKLKPRQVTSKIVDDLKGRRLIMPIVDAKNPDLLLESLLFKIDTISISDQKSKSDQHSANLLGGLALMSAKVLKRHSETDVVTRQSCQAACLSDFNCRSYSICARGHAIDCRISEVDFGDEQLMIQLEEKRKEVTRTKRHQINLDYQPPNIKGQASESPKRVVELLVDKRCQIYKNRAIDMFSEMSRASTRVELDQLDQVDNKEECARLCLEENINYFKKYQNFSPVDLKTGHVEAIRKHYAKGLKEWCSTFRYSDLMISSKMSDAFSGLKKNGLCLYSKGLRNRPSEETPNTTAPTSIEMDIFEFNHINLYAARPNVVMKPYYPDSDSSNEPANRRRLSHMTTLEDCARACFSQTTELVPYCKSFEYIVAKVPTSGVMEESTRADVITQCAFNTMNIDDAIASNHYDKIVETRHEPSIESSNHYEPLKAYWVNPQFITEDPAFPSESVLVKMGDVLSGLALIVTALISGIYIGSRIERPILEYWIVLKKRADSIRFQRFPEGIS